MSKVLTRTALSLSALMFIVIVVGSVVIVAQAPVTGTWTANTKNGKEDKAENAGKIHLSFERQTAHGRNQNGSSYAFDELQGLTREQTQNGKVSFRLVREAGTVDCEGSFVNGEGSGTFRFTPNQSYVEAMRSRGFDFEKTSKNYGGDDNNKLLSAALINVTIALADDLKASGFTLDVDDLFKAAIFKVDSKFMAEMRATGYPNLTMEDLVKARIFKIDPEFVTKISEMGLVTKDFEGLVKYSIFKVTPEYLAEMKTAGFDKLSSEQVVQFRIFNVTPQYLGELKAAGLQNLDSEEVVKSRIFNIDPEFIRKARAEDPNVTMEQLVQMKIGVRKMKGTE